MKKGWTYKKLGEVFKTYAGGTPSKANKANYINGTIPWLRSGEVCKKYITESELYISEEGLRNSSAKYYPINTVLIAMYGATAAQCGILKFEATSNQAVCGVLPQKDFLPEFVYSYFVYIKDALAAQAQGGAQPNISQEKIKNVYFPCIPLSEQKLIVSRLDAAFSHIDELKANAKKQLSEARALFQKSLAKAMEPKEGWKEMFLGKIAYIFSGYAFKSADFKDYGKYQVLRIGNIKQNLLRLSENAVFIDKIDDGLLKKSLLQKGDLVITQIGTRHKRDYGFVAMVDKINLLLNQRNACLRFDNVITAKFFLYYSYTELFKDSFFANEGGTVGQGNVGLGTLKDMCCHFPPLSEQQRIVERLDALSVHVRELEENQKKIISECDALKQALLRKVFE